jgi:hypothetical protein
VVTETREPGNGGLSGAEFAALLQGHATLSLTAEERDRLLAACAGHPARAAQLEAFTRLHEVFARERAVFTAVAAPPDPAEEGDEGFARLAAAGARAQAELRSRLVHAPAQFPVVLPRRRRRILVGLALLAAAMLAAFGLGVFDAGPPRLRPSAPLPGAAGGEGQSIVIAPRLSAADRTLSWSPLWHAQSYDVVVVDAAGNVVLRRSPDHARSTRWELTTAEFEQLRARRLELRLRVRALDGAGLPVGTSGDLPLALD